jgi:hypothetical protein
MSTVHYQSHSSGELRLAHYNQGRRFDSPLSAGFGQTINSSTGKSDTDEGGGAGGNSRPGPNGHSNPDTENESDLASDSKGTFELGQDSESNDTSKLGKNSDTKSSSDSCAGGNAQR